MPVPKSPAVAYRVFRASGVASWDRLFDLAAEFASTLDRRQLINISHSSDSGSGTVVVWFQKELP